MVVTFFRNRKQCVLSAEVCITTTPLRYMLESYFMLLCYIAYIALGPFQYGTCIIIYLPDFDDTPNVLDALFHYNKAITVCIAAHIKMH